MPGLALSLFPRSAPRPTKAGQGQSGCVSIFRKSTIGFLMFLILSHTSVCLPIPQVVHGKHHRIKKLEARHRGLAGSTSMPGFGIVPLTRSAPRPTKAGQGQSGCVSIFRKSTIGFLMFLSCPLRVGQGLRCMFRFYDLQ